MEASFGPKVSIKEEEKSLPLVPLLIAGRKASQHEKRIGINSKPHKKGVNDLINSNPYG